MWADDLAATCRSFDIFRKLASTILDEWSAGSYANNHYAGHGPATVAQFMKLWNAKGFPLLRSAAFIEPMECLAVPKLFGGSEWIYEIELDGCRSVAAKSDRGVRLFSRHNKSFNNQYPDIVEVLGRLSENTVDA